MTLPKGYKPPNNNNNNFVPRRKKGSPKKAIFFFILFLISLAFFVNAIMNYIETGKELDEQKKIVAKSKANYEKTYKEIYGRLPPNSP